MTRAIVENKYSGRVGKGGVLLLVSLHKTARQNRIFLDWISLNASFLGIGVSGALAGMSMHRPSAGISIHDRDNG